MKNEITEKPTALASLANRLSISPEKLENTLKKTVFKKCQNDEEFAVLIAVSNEYQLNPLTKQIYAFPAKGGGIEPIVSIDGWLSIINNQVSFDGMTVDMSQDGEEATCSIFVKGRSHPTVITEYLSECKRPTEPWQKMPKRMLRHKAIMQCGRVAFGISGIYDEDEAKDISMRNVTPPHSQTIKRDTPLTLDSEKPKKEKDVTKEPKKEKVSSPLSEVFIMNVTKKNGETNGKKWTKYDVEVSMGDAKGDVTTFSKTIGELALTNVNNTVLASFEKGDKGTTLAEIKPLNKEDIPNENS